MSSETSVVVTGAAGGLGSLIVATLVERGVNVVCVDRDQAALDRMIGGLSGSGETLAVAGDVSNEEQVAAFIDAGKKKWGRLTGAVFAAAINGDAGKLHESPTQVFDDVIRINTKSVWLGMKYLLPVLLENGGGSIVSVGSVAALRGAPNLAAYAASKHAVVGLSQTVALEYATANIRSNVVCPGSMNTQLIRPMLAVRGAGDEAEGERQTVAGIPNGRLAQPEELAATAIWLLLDAPTHLTGQEVVVDGGRTAL